MPASAGGGKPSYRRVTPHEPCPVCAHGTWCRVSADGVVVACSRMESSRPREYRDGNPYWLHFTSDRRLGPEALKAAPRRAEAPRAAPDLLDRMHRQLLDLLTLTGRHRRALLARGLDPEAIEAGLFRTWPDADGSRPELLRRLGQDFSVADLLTLPGIWRDKDRVRLAGSPGLAIPVHDAEGRILAICLRPDEPKGPKYVWLTSNRKGYTGPTAHLVAHVPPGHEGDTTTVRVTEGVLKAAVATHLSGTLTVGLPGVAWAFMLPALDRLGAEVVWLAFDMDREGNRHVMHAQEQAAQAAHRSGRKVFIERWNAAHKGIDDALLARLKGGQP